MASGVETAGHSPMELEWTPCVVCDGIETKPLFAESYRGTEFSVVQCRGCGLVYLNPRPSLSRARTSYPDPDLKKSSSTPGFRPDAGITPRVGFRSKYFEFYDRLAQASPDPKVLDFVCRNGSFLELLRERHGWRQLYGTEIRPMLAKIAAESGFEVHVGLIEQANFPDNFFDLVVSRHTFEHLNNPLVALKEIHRTLKDDGLLRIEVPNVSSLSKLISGKRWMGFYIPWHVYYFSPQTLTKLLAKAGFKVVESKTLPYPHFLLSSVLTLLNKWLPRKQKKTIGGVFRPGNSVLVGAVLYPLNLLASLANKGDEIMLICQKVGQSEKH